MNISFPLLLDGAFGTRIQKQGFRSGECPEIWSLEHAEVVKAIQQSYIEAGSKIIYAPTFGANDLNLERHGVFNRTGELNTRLVALSKEAAGDKILVAGDMTSAGELLYPLGDSSFEDMYDMYAVQAEALEKAGVDLYVIETMTNIPEARAAVLAVKSVSDKPVFVTFSCDANGRTMTGTDVCAALAILQGMGIDAFGLNCSAGPKEMLPQFRKLKKYASVPLIAKPNAGLPEMKDGEMVYTVDPEEFASFAPELAREGVCMFGGCCGTDERYIAALRTALEGAECSCPKTENPEMLPCATERNIFLLAPDASVEEIIACDDDFEDNICEADSGALVGIEIRCAGDLAVLMDCQACIRNPLCIMCDDAELLEKALRLFQGRALYEGTLSKEELLPLAGRYGLVIRQV